jgi:predicted nucleic acid binding AN1-type Zn finger protein
MKSFSIRLGIVMGVLAVIIAGATVLAKGPPKDTTRCSSWLKKNVCTTTCENSVYTHGVCRDDSTGAESAITFECCCCTAGAENRSFIGG